MKPTTILTGLAAAALSGLSASPASAAAAEAAPASPHRTTSTTIYIQAIAAPGSSDDDDAEPAPLATVRYATGEGEDGLDDGDDDVEILSYEAPDLPAGTRLVRVGAWDDAGGWASATTLASAENFARGYAPTLALTVTGTPGEEGAALLGVAVKGVAVDAGHTRDFGPKAVLRRPRPGRQVDLGKPVLLGPEGRKVEPEPEKSFLQKYWWLIGVVVLLTMTGGGEGGK